MAELMVDANKDKDKVITKKEGEDAATSNFDAANGTRKWPKHLKNIARIITY